MIWRLQRVYIHVSDLSELTTCSRNRKCQMLITQMTTIYVRCLKTSQTRWDDKTDINWPEVAMWYDLFGGKTNDWEKRKEMMKAFVRRPQTKAASGGGDTWEDRISLSILNMQETRQIGCQTQCTHRTQKWGRRKTKEWGDRLIRWECQCADTTWDEWMFTWQQSSHDGPVLSSLLNTFRMLIPGKHIFPKTCPTQNALIDQSGVQRRNCCQVQTFERKLTQSLTLPHAHAHAHAVTNTGAGGNNNPPSLASSTSRQGTIWCLCETCLHSCNREFLMCNKLTL